MDMSKLLLDEPPLVILPTLANRIGLNEAIILQQIHYWIKRSDKLYDGKKWTYNTYEDWVKQFPFWSISTVRRALSSLEKQELIITGNYNKMKADKTKWYTVNYEKYEGLNSPSVQNEQSNCSKWTASSVQNEQSNTLDLPKNSPDKYSELFDEFWKVYPRKTDRKAAVSKFKTAIKEHSFEQVLSGTKGYVEDIKKNNTDKRYIKHAKTFLNQQSYLDFIDQRDYQEETSEEFNVADELKEIEESIRLGRPYYERMNQSSRYEELLRERDRLEQLRAD